jgi:hypothetical protein
MKLHGMIWAGMLVVSMLTCCAGIAIAQETKLAQTPPMGWNSWDAYGESVKESDIRASAEWMAKNLKPYGWQYVVVDAGWYVKNHNLPPNSKDAQFSLDEFGRYIPATNSIPSAANGAGFQPLADYVHSLGLKFGLHLIRGIPREAVAKNMPIANSPYHAQDAADTSDVCPWNSYNYGLDTTKLAARAYYESLAAQLVAWHVDFLKVDCISSHPYKGDEIRLLSESLRKAGRPIVLSLSPGPAPLEKADEMAKYSNMWRISDDEWDLWYGTQDFPQGVNNQIDRAVKWAAYSKPGNWPDADMLAIGQLKPSAGWGDPRASRLTKDEQRTLLTLWSIFRSPLIMGGNLLLCDDWTKSLLTNPEVIAVDQHSKGNHAAITTEKAAVWVAQPDSGEGFYVAVFNRSDAAQEMKYAWKEIGVGEGKFPVRDLWEHKELGPADGVDVTLPAHASALYLVRPEKK